MKSYAKIAQSMYEAYRLYIQISIGVNVPSWESPFMYEKKAWIAAAKAAHKEIMEVH